MMSLKNQKSELKCESADMFGTVGKCECAGKCEYVGKYGDAGKSTCKFKCR